MFIKASREYEGCKKVENEVSSTVGELEVFLNINFVPCIPFCVCFGLC